MQRTFRRVSPAILLAVFTAAAGLGVGAGALGLHKPPTSPVIATVDLEKVYNGLNKRTEKEKEFEAKRTEFNTRLDTLSKQIEADKKEYETMPDGVKKKALGQTLIRNALQLKFDKEYAEQFLDQMYGEMLREMYDEISASSKLLAEKAGYHMVVADDSGARIRGSGRAEVNRLIALKRNLYVNSTMDVTQELIDMMNNDFATNPKK